MNVDRIITTGLEEASQQMGKTISLDNEHGAFVRNIWEIIYPITAVKLQDVIGVDTRAVIGI